MQRNGLTYADAGVDIAASDALVRRIAPAARETQRAGVMGGIGGFGALFDIGAAGYRDPILVAATDGVGTKLKVAIEAGRLGGLGQDLVAMCVNDLACQGADPLFFLDYLATGRLDVDQAVEVVEGIAQACASVDCALIGGETAEMPGLYRPGDFDLAGFAVGAVERDAVLPAGVEPGDVLVGLPSSGLHSNGFSLVRRLVEEERLDWAGKAPFEEDQLAHALLEPTRLYVHAVRAARAAGGLKGAAHITGGGITENLPRILPDGCGARVDLDAWHRPDVFGWLQGAGGVETSEMLKTFNCGAGMVLVVGQGVVTALLEALSAAGESPMELGAVEAGAGVRYIGEW